MLAYPGWNAYAMGMFRIRDDRIRLSMGRVRVDRSLGGDEPFSGWWTGESNQVTAGIAGQSPGPRSAGSLLDRLYGPSNPHPLDDGRLLWLGTGTNGRDEGWQVGVSITDADGSAYGPVSIVAAADDRNYADPDMARLPDGRSVAVIREMVTRRSVAAISSDEGATWSSPVPTGYGGWNHTDRAGLRRALVRLPRRRSETVWRQLERYRRRAHVALRRSAVSRRRRCPDEPTLYCGYPAVARLSSQELLCVIDTYVDDMVMPTCIRSACATSPD